MFSKLGARVIDADKISHQLITPRGRCFYQVIKAFGRGILHNGKIDRKKLSVIVFEGPGELKKLSRIIHPQVIREIKERIQFYRKNKKVNAVVIDAPLLVEAGLHRLADITVVVKAERAQQIKRLRGRMAISTSEIVKRINAQMDINKKIRLADFVVDNRGSLAQTEKQVKRIWQTILKKKSRQVKTWQKQPKRKHQKMVQEKSS